MIKSKYLEPGQALESACLVIQSAIIGEDVDEFQAVPLAGVKIIGIVRGRNLHSPCSKLHIHQLCVGHDRNASLAQWMHCKLPNDPLVPVAASEGLSSSFQPADCPE